MVVEWEEKKDSICMGTVVEEMVQRLHSIFYDFGLKEKLDFLIPTQLIEAYEGKFNCKPGEIFRNMAKNNLYPEIKEYKCYWDELNIIIDWYITKMSYQDPDRSFYLSGSNVTESGGWILAVSDVRLLGLFNDIKKIFNNPRICYGSAKYITGETKPYILVGFKPVWLVLDPDIPKDTFRLYFCRENKIDKEYTTIELINVPGEDILSIKDLGAITSLDQFDNYYEPYRCLVRQKFGKIEDSCFYITNGQVARTLNIPEEEVTFNHKQIVVKQRFESLSHQLRLLLAELTNSAIYMDAALLNMKTSSSNFFVLAANKLAVLQCIPELEDELKHPSTDGYFTLHTIHNPDEGKSVFRLVLDDTIPYPIIRVYHARETMGAYSECHFKLSNTYGEIQLIGFPNIEELEEFMHLKSQVVGNSRNSYL